MNEYINGLKEAWDKMPEDGKSWIDLYYKGNQIAAVHKSARDFGDVLCPGDHYVWWVTPEVAIQFDSWEENMHFEGDLRDRRSAAKIISFYRTPEIKPDTAQNHLFNVEFKFATARVNFLSKWLIDELYETYKDSDIDTLLVIDRKEFERFVKRCYPLWKEGRI